MAIKIVSALDAGTNLHSESAFSLNALATDLLGAGGVIGAITNTSGIAPTTGAYAVNAQSTPNMSVRVTNGVLWMTGTPTGGVSQAVRVRMDASEDVNVASNSSGSTKYDWLYMVLDAAKMANPAADASDVATLFISRSTSNTVDNGTPPTYGLCLAVITVANGAASITNANIADARVRAGVNSISQNANVPTGQVVQVQQTDYSAAATGTTIIPADNTTPQITEGDQFMSLSFTPKSASNTLIVEAVVYATSSAINNLIAAIFKDSGADALAAGMQYGATATGSYRIKISCKAVAGSTSAQTWTVRVGASAAGTTTFNGLSGVSYLGATAAKSYIRITEVKV